jgi:hypothetical protein
LLSESAIEQQSAICKAVNVRRFDDFLSVTTEFREKIVERHKQNIVSTFRDILTAGAEARERQSDSAG